MAVCGRVADPLPAGRDQRHRLGDAMVTAGITLLAARTRFALKVPAPRKPSLDAGVMPHWAALTLGLKARPPSWAPSCSGASRTIPNHPKPSATFQNRQNHPKSSPNRSGACLAGAQTIKKTSQTISNIPKPSKNIQSHPQTAWAPQEGSERPQEVTFVVKC